MWLYFFTPLRTTFWAFDYDLAVNCQLFQCFSHEVVVGNGLVAVHVCKILERHPVSVAIPDYARKIRKQSRFGVLPCHVVECHSLEVTRWVGIRFVLEHVQASVTKVAVTV